MTSPAHAESTVLAVLEAQGLIFRCNGEEGTS